MPNGAPPHLRLACRLRQAHRPRNRKVGQGGEVRGRQSGLIRQSRQIFYNVSFGKNVGSSHVATGTIGFNLRPLSGRSCAAGSPATDCFDVLLVRVDALRPATRVRPRARHSMSKISAKIPVRDFLVSANIPTGLDCAGLFWGRHWGLLGQLLVVASGHRSCVPFGASLALIQR